MSAGETVAILDAGPLIHLDELGSLRLRAWRREQISKAEACDLLSALPDRSTLHLRPSFLEMILRQLSA